MSFLLGLAIGFAVGWLVLKRPDWMTSIINKIKSLLHIATPTPPPPAT